MDKKRLIIRMLAAAAYVWLCFWLLLLVDNPGSERLYIATMILVSLPPALGLAWMALRKGPRSPTSAGAVPCPNCGYNLRGLTAADCPECGEKFTLEELVPAVPVDRRPV